MTFFVHAGWPIVLVLWLALMTASTAFARSWSYHYQPITPQPSPVASSTQASLIRATPVPSEQATAARLLKRAIISDLSLYVMEQGVRSNEAFAEHSEYLLGRLSLFDSLNSPRALEVFAGLSGYYLGARGEGLFDCLALRKGKSLEPYLEQHMRNGSAECSQQLGPDFTVPTDALGGHALCPNGEQQRSHLTALIAEIGSGKPCSNSDLATVAASHRPSPAKTP
jgi:hypothetical protein